LVKANWQNLSQLEICEINTINLGSNYIGVDGVTGMRLSLWPLLKKVKIRL
jgi:hypothetical protein